MGLVVGWMRRGLLLCLGSKREGGMFWERGRGGDCSSKEDGSVNAAKWCSGKGSLLWQGR